MGARSLSGGLGGHPQEGSGERTQAARADHQEIEDSPQRRRDKTATKSRTHEDDEEGAAAYILARTGALPFCFVIFVPSWQTFALRLHPGRAAEKSRCS